MSVKILKASAGSGKTYRLSKTYIDLLLKSKDPCPYRHILAVTFTNKATAEMKSRILRDLYDSEEPKAKKLLIDILHDYSAFSVTTIDKFFQRALKSFSREIGQMDDYQIELDRTSLIHESVDRILDSLTEDDKELIEWIKSSVAPLLEQGQKLNIEDGLYDIGKQLKREDYRKLSAALKASGEETDFLERERLRDLAVTCDEIISSFEAVVASYGFEAEPGKRLDFTNKKTLLKKNPDLAAYKDDNYSEYVTAHIIKSLIFSLGLSGEISKEFDALTKEKNVMCLDESNVFLKEIIGGSDAPFVFEKIGVRYDHFLLDEFQDTSNIQWENFLPLLKEADSKGSNLVVGDIKQSIYRFRDSDWQLLGKTVAQEFPNARIEVLDNNWRSAREVVSFNNAFFTFAASRLGLQEIYSDVVQNPMTKDPQRGYVRVSYTEDQKQMVYDSIMAAREAGAQWGDIAVLVRKNVFGKQVADFLIEKEIPIISDDSLDVHSSLAVRRLVSLLSAFDAPDDQLGAFLSREMGVEFPESYHSLVDLCEHLLREMHKTDPEVFDGEQLYVQSFLDELLSWSTNYGNNLTQFLKYWKDKSLCISTPDSGTAVRILTVHKSKGLEFPFVIFPFADEVEFYKAGTKWCHLSEGSTDNADLKGIYPVSLGKAAAESAFAPHRDEEARQQLIDNINIFYVSLTRAEKSLHIISAPPTKKFKDSLAKGKAEYNNFSSLLYEYIGGMEEWHSGEPYDYTKLQRKREQLEQEMPVAYCSTALGGRLSPSVEAVDFFTDEGVAAGVDSPRVRGIVLHEILSHVDSVSDVRGAVAAAVKDALLSESEAALAADLLEKRVAAHPQWFDDAATVLNERSIFASDGSEYRPDRVVLDDDGVTVVDFKFGLPEKKYLKQVGRYAGLYESLGYKVKAAVVWYVETDNCEYL